MRLICKRHKSLLEVQISKNQSIDQSSEFMYLSVLIRCKITLKPTQVHKTGKAKFNTYKKFYKIVTNNYYENQRVISKPFKMLSKMVKKCIAGSVMQHLGCVSGGYFSIEADLSRLQNSPCKNWETNWQDFSSKNYNE